MTDLALPQAYSAEKHVEALENLVKKYDKDEQPVKYSDAAIDMDPSSCSSCLSFWAAIGLIQAEKQGYYVPNQSTSNFVLQYGEAERRAREEIVEELSEDDIYEKLEFIVENSEFGLEKLALEVGGKVGIKEDDVRLLKRYIEILIEFGILERGEDGNIALPEEEQNSDTQDGSSVEENREEDELSGKKRESDRKKIPVSIDVSVDLAEIEAEELDEKLQTLHKYLAEEKINDG